MTSAAQKHRKAIKKAIAIIEQAHADAAGEGPTALAGSLGSALACLLETRRIAKRAIIQERVLEAQAAASATAVDWRDGPEDRRTQWIVTVGCTDAGSDGDKIAAASRSFRWIGPADGPAMAKAAAMRHAETAWRILTAIGGKPIPFPKGIASKAVCEENHLGNDGTFSIGRLMLSALASAGLPRAKITAEGIDVARAVGAMAELAACQSGHPTDMRYVTLMTGRAHGELAEPLANLLHCEAIMEFGFDDGYFTRVLPLDPPLSAFLMAASIVNVLMPEDERRYRCSVEQSESATLKAALRKELLDNEASNKDIVTAFLRRVGLPSEADAIEERTKRRLDGREQSEPATKEKA